MTNPDDISLLCREVERVFGASGLTPRGFDRLRSDILERTGVLLSSTTLKRIWGYLDEGVEPRRSTLDILALYAGWQSLDHLLHGIRPDLESGIVAQARINVLRDLKPGAALRLFWQPGRMCEVSYLGNARFRVERSIATRLSPGDTFTCHLIVSGEPLYLDSLTGPSSPTPAVYVCGRKNGITFLYPIPLPD